MTAFRVLLMSGACFSLLVLHSSGSADGRLFANTIKARVDLLQRLHHGAPFTLVAAADNSSNNQTEQPGRGTGASGDPEHGGGESGETDVANTSNGKGETLYYGISEQKGTPPWAAEAKVFEEVVVTAPAAAADAPAAAATEAPAAEGTAAPETATETPPGPQSTPAPAVPGETWYGGETKSAADQPFSAPAQMMAVEAPAAAAEKETVYSQEPGPQSTPAPPVAGQTWSPGETKRAEDQPFSAPAKMMPVAAAAPAAPAAVTPTASACRDKLNAAVQAGRILFGIGNWDIRPESYNTLDKLAAIAKGCDGTIIEIGGHTDNTGSVSGNEQLSRMRAEAVAKYLTKEGVNSAKLKAVGYGQSQPLADNKTAEGRQKNRRIEFLVTGG